MCEERKINVKVKSRDRREDCRDVQSKPLVTKSDVTNFGCNEAKRLVPAKILLYMTKNTSDVTKSDVTKCRL